MSTAAVTTAAVTTARLVIGPEQMRHIVPVGAEVRVVGTLDREVVYIYHSRFGGAVYSRYLRAI